MAVVYLVTNTQNGKIYVGKTKLTAERRWYHHVRSASAGSPYAFHRAIRKYGETSFFVSTLGDYATEELALSAEKSWIATLEAFGPKGYNMCEGGRGAVGYKHTDEAKAAMREIAIAKGQVPSEYAVRRSAEVRALGFSDAAKLHIKEGQLQRRATQPITDEFRENCRMAMEARLASGWKPTPHTEERKLQIGEWSKTYWSDKKSKPICAVCAADQTAENSTKDNRRSTGLARLCRGCARDKRASDKNNKMGEDT